VHAQARDLCDLSDRQVKVPAQDEHKPVPVVERSQSTPHLDPGHDAVGAEVNRAPGR